MSDHGLEAEIRALIEGELGGEEPEALDLFGDMPSPVQLQAQHRGIELRRPGRPAGSRNRSTLDVVKLLKATRRPALLALKELQELPLHEFMRLTGIDDADKAFGRWLQITELVTAYEEGRPTQRVEVQGQVALPVLVMGDAPVRPDLVNGNPPDESEVIQGVAVDVTDQVARSKSHDEPQAIEWTEEPDA